MRRVGYCALTGNRGKFVDAHIIPLSLSKPDRGRFWIESGTDQRPLRRWTSWYDSALVTADGEAILAKIDDAGIRVLREHQLIWSSFEDRSPCFDDWTPIGSGGHGVRVIENVDTATLRIFLLSVLWRAAATRRPEFRQIRLPKGKMELLGKVITGEVADRRMLHPVVLTQISTIGERHNFAPQRENKIVELKKGRRKIPIFRFFFDGLVAHFHVRSSIKNDGGLGLLEVGVGNRLGLLTIPFENSAQFERLEFFKLIAERQWPTELSNLVQANWRNP